MGFEERAELMAADPETYYITDHYLNYRGCWFACRGFIKMPCAISSAGAAVGCGGKAAQVGPPAQ